MLTDKTKEYVAVLKLGVVTDTQDLTGTVLEEHPVTVTEEQIRETIFSFQGDQLQIPPMYSALKVNGKKLYELAREGKEVERAARPITIHEIEILKEELPEITIRVSCSKGTYIRTLCHDIGQALAEKLGYAFYDQEIIEMTAGTTGYTPEFIQKKEEMMTSSFLYDLVNQMYMYAQPDEEAPKDKIYEAESSVVRELAAKGNCVIVGRCSDYILRDNKNCLRVFLSAPMENRMKRVMDRLHLSEKDAKQKIQKEDKWRADNYRYYTGRIWGASSNFDLTVNTALGEEYIEMCIREAMKR